MALFMFGWGLVMGWFLHAFWPDFKFFITGGKK